MATAPWQEGIVPTEAADGIVTVFTWQVRSEGLTSLSLLTTLREQIEAQGFEVLFSCASQTCGGFDFRHALPLGQAPDMYIDLGNYHYLTARADGPDGAETLALTVSMGGAAGYVHLALVQPETEVEAASPVVQSSRAPDPAEPDAAPITAPQTTPDELIDLLLRTGSAPLGDLQFETGASALSGDSYPSLTALAGFLAENPARRIVLVGHTDAMGSLAGNIALSQARAAAVRQFLTSRLDVRASQVEAHGIGFLAPRAPNTTPEGRESNRRVEVVLADPG
jgi:OOP family OmpA-OmpF porin